MKSPPTARRFKPRTRSARALGPGETPTVASLGVQARLFRADPDRERKITVLIASYDRLCVEWEELFQQAVDLLGDASRADLDDNSSTMHSTAD